MKEHALVLLATQFAKPIAHTLGCEVWGIRILRGRTTILQCFIDKESGATIDDCSNFSRALGAELDNIGEDDMTYKALGALQAYTLEVSTPGLERCFFSVSQLHQYIGQNVSIVLERPLPMFPNRRKMKGKLSSIEDTLLRIAVNGEEVLYECPWDNIERIHLVYFDN